MKKTTIPSTLLLMFALFQITRAQSGGQIIDVDNKGIPGVSVSGNLNCKGGIPIGDGQNFSLSAVTDENGRYNFILPPMASTSSCLTSTVTITALSKPNYTFFGVVGIEAPLFQTVSAADYKAVAASEMIAAGFSQALSQMTEAATTFQLPTTLADRSVAVSHTAGIEKNAELIFVSPTQINYIVPPGLPPGRAFVKVREGDRLVRAGVIEIKSTAPSLFTLAADGAGLPTAFVLRIKSDRTESYELIAGFDQDEGKFVPLPIDLDSETDMVFLGLLGTGFRNRSSLGVVTAKIGGMPVDVLYAGMQGSPGLDQVNLRVPRDLLGRGKVNVELTVEGKAVNVVEVVSK